LFVLPIMADYRPLVSWLFVCKNSVLKGLSRVMSIVPILAFLFDCLIVVPL
jgi:hypothetical protein